MSLRALIRIEALALGLVLFSPLLWPAAGLWPLLAGLGLSLSMLAYLTLSTARTAVSRWQLRYQMESRQPNERLDATLSFLAERAGQVVLGANSQGLYLEAPAAFDRYVQAQLERALPEARVGRLSDEPSEGEIFLCLDPLAGDPLRWATEGQGRHVRLYLHRGPHWTLLAQTARDAPPPGAWVETVAPCALSTRLWRRLPVWDELAAGLRPSHLLPITDNGAVYSSHSRLLHLAPPESYKADGDRHLGTATDGRGVGLSRSIPLFTTGAPASFLVQQALEDLRSGWAVVVVSPQRKLLHLVERQAQATTHWFDPENSRGSVHLAVAAADEWDCLSSEKATELVETLLADLPALDTGSRPGGLDLHLPAVRTAVQDLVRILAASARTTGHDLSFTDLYAISQSPQTLRAFLDDLQGVRRELDPETRVSIGSLAEHLEGDAGYVQIVTILSMLRTVLSPLRSGPLHILCQPPFANASQVLHSGHLLLVPMVNADFPERDRFLMAMLDLTLRRVLTTGGQDLRVALHLHDPHRYSPDDGRRWASVASRDARISLLLDVQDPDKYAAREGDAGHLVFGCSETLASTLVDTWQVGYTAAELADLPAGTALARLPGLPSPITLQLGGGQ